MHHKRGRSKSRRSGSCSGHKRFKFNGFKGTGDARTRQEVWADDSLAADRVPRRVPARKRWVVEYRRRPGRPGSLFGFSLGPKEWRVWRRYASQTARDTFLAHAERRSRNDIGPLGWLWRDCEFRAAYR